MQTEIDKFNDIVRTAFCGSLSDNNARGIISDIEDVVSNLSCYLKKIEGDKSFQCVTWTKQDLCENIEKCKKELEDKMSEINQEDSAVVACNLANLFAIPEHLEIVCFFLERISQSTTALMKEFLKISEPTEEHFTSKGLSPYANLEIKDICQRLMTIAFFTKYIVSNDFENPSLYGPEEVNKITEQLEDFTEIAMQRHTNRLRSGACQLTHDTPYRNIFVAAKSIAFSLGVIAYHWLESNKPV